MKYISFAIPCYNSEAYMEKAINSILVGGEDVEIIVVNDGSKDGTQEIAERYQEKYPTIVKAVAKPNGGHGDAVNCGLEHATGKYFKVVDLSLIHIFISRSVSSLPMQSAAPYSFLLTGGNAAPFLRSRCLPSSRRHLRPHLRFSSGNTEIKRMNNQIRSLRTEKGLSQEELARRCGVTRQTVNAIENNKYDPTLSLAFRLADALGTTVDALFLRA